MSLPINDQQAGLINAVVNEMAEDQEFRRVIMVCMRKTLLPWEHSADALKEMEISFVRKNLLGKVVTPPGVKNAMGQAAVDELLREQKFKLVE